MSEEKYSKKPTYASDLKITPQTGEGLLVLLPSIVKIKPLFFIFYPYCSYKFKFQNSEMVSASKFGNVSEFGNSVFPNLEISRTAMDYLAKNS
jgi:hypothetical protein